MWQLDNRTPFAAGQCWIRDRLGAEVWLVVVHASFDIGEDGVLTVSKEQTPPLYVPEFRGEPGASSLRRDTDFVLEKRCTDILLEGHACAPYGRTVGSLDVAMRVGPVQKVLRVFGDRTWGVLGPSEPVPFSQMPLTFERAYGGRSRRSTKDADDHYWPNPVGTGYAADGREADEVALPNIEFPDALLHSWRDRPRPAGFGPIASHWQSRAVLAGTYGERWQEQEAPLLPSDLDPGFFQCAPPDQQAPGFLQGGEPVTLLNLTPSGRLDFLLPRMALELETRFHDGERRPGEAHLHTVLLQPDSRRVSLVWHLAQECHAKAYQLDHTRIGWGLVGEAKPAAAVESLLDLL
ncbi:DUF2169 domain-containing protein [Ideonella sp.]|uniref:DUF2169 family type VI secretion system accessory protein n=1 Tax=Ideonella sp. TaxID=1929293 RepID=UPI0035AF356C